MEPVLLLAHELGFSEEVLAMLAEIATTPDESILLDLTDPMRFGDAVERMKAWDDPRGIMTLYHKLSAALRTRDKYREVGIDDSIFLATMDCFPRFVGEHMASYGTYAFDRAFWTGRQTSMLLFRLGTLEYETVNDHGKPMISVHIPSNADLSAEALDASIAAAHDFFARHNPAYADAEYMCYSWLLAPPLEQLIPGSKIVAFQRRFAIKSYNPDTNAYVQWVFGDPRLSPEEFSETTRLQRAVKRHVLTGGKIGEAYGILK